MNTLKQRIENLEQARAPGEHRRILIRPPAGLSCDCDTDDDGNYQWQQGQPGLNGQRVDVGVFDCAHIADVSNQAER